MKKIVPILFAGVLVSALGASFVACGKHDSSAIRLDPLADCWVFIKQTPGEETILLAKSGLNLENASVVIKEFESQYIGEDIKQCISHPDARSDLRHYLSLNPDTVTDCYEITIVADVSSFAEADDSQVRKMFLEYADAVRVTDEIAICKLYRWAFTEDSAKGWALFSENNFKNTFCGDNYKVISHVSTTVKKLGPEVHNEPIVF